MIQSYAVMWDAPEDGGWNEHYTVSAPETEDESDLVNGGQCPPIQQVSKPKDAPRATALAKSYAKLEKAIPLGYKSDKWHDWFQMQADWMKNVEKDPEHYFDDYL